MYLNITHSNGYIEKKGVNKCLVFDSKDENKELLKKCDDVFNGIRDKIKEISSNVIMKKIIWRLNLIQMMIYH